MTLNEYGKKIESIKDQAKKDDDSILFMAFSQEENAYRGFEQNMDGGDALIVIMELMKAFDIVGNTLITMQPHSLDA